MRRILRTIFKEDKEEFDTCVLELNKLNRVIEVAILLTSGESKLVSIPYKQQQNPVSVAMPSLPCSIKTSHSVWQQIVEKFPPHLQEAKIIITDTELTLQSYSHQCKFI